MADQNPINLKIIIGSVREGRFSDRPAQWIFDEAKKTEGVTAELLDLRDYPMPFFDEPVSPSYATEPYKNEFVQKWRAKIEEGDAFIVIAPEYNHSIPAVLKNALDYVYKEWNRKAMAFVAHGSVGGARSVEHLRAVAVELQMAPVRAAVHIPWPLMVTASQAPMPVDPKVFDPVKDSKDSMFTQLLWWARALKTARANS